MTKYGKPSEVAMSLPQINNSSPHKSLFHEFSEKLLWSVQALDTMGKNKRDKWVCESYTWKTAGYSSGSCKKRWQLAELEISAISALEKCTVRNPLVLSDNRNPEKGNSYSKSYQAKQTKNECMYCEKPDHKSSDCKTAKPMTERRKILSNKKLCFSCTGAKHRVTECFRAKTWLKCKTSCIYVW